MRSRLFALTPVFAMLLAASAQAEEKKVRKLQLPESPFRYSDATLPEQLKSAEARRLDNTPTSNAITDAGATLGRVLFSSPSPRPN